jgi:hypothetical protein
LCQKNGASSGGSPDGQEIFRAYDNLTEIAPGILVSECLEKTGKPIVSLPLQLKDEGASDVPIGPVSVFLSLKRIPIELSKIAQRQVFVGLLIGLGKVLKKSTNVIRQR